MGSPRSTRLVRRVIVLVLALTCLVVALWYRSSEPDVPAPLGAIVAPARRSVFPTAVLPGPSVEPLPAIGVAADAGADGGAPCPNFVSVVVHTLAQDRAAVPHVAVEAEGRTLRACGKVARAESDGAGIAHLQLPVGGISLTGRTRNLFGHQFLTVLPEGGELEVFLMPTDRLKVTVRDDRGAVAGASVAVFPSAEGTTGPDGVVWLEGVRIHGEYLQVNAPGHVQVLRDLDLSVNHEVTVFLVRGVEVVVDTSESENCRVPWVRVQERSPVDGGLSTNLGEELDGGWLFVLAPGAYTASGEVRGICEGRADFEVGTEPTRVRLELRPVRHGASCKITGDVVDEAGHPRSGVEVWAACSDQRLKTGTSGEFSFAAHQGQACEVFVEDARAAAHCGAPMHVVVGTATLTITITGPDVSPRELIVLEGPRAFRVTTKGSPATVRGLAAGTYVARLMFHSGFSQVEVPTGRQVSMELRALEGAGRVRGTLVSDDGMPLVGTVQAFGAPVSTDAAGDFDLRLRVLGPQFLCGWTDDGRVGLAAFTLRDNKTLELGQVVLTNSRVRDFGFRAQRQGEVCIARDLRPGGPADRAGLREGEQVRVLRLGSYVLSPSCEVLNALTLRPVPWFTPLVLVVGEDDRAIVLEAP